MAKRLKVLLSAYSCEPGKGSEPEVGWQWALQMARFHDVTVLTRANNRPSIEPELARLQHEQPLPDFVYLDRGPGLLEFKRRFKAITIYYLLWQRSARELVETLHAAHHYDLMHHVTFAAFRYPIAIWGHDVPCIWGPVGGIESVPRSLLPWQHSGSLVHELIRNAHNLLQATPFNILPRRARASTLVLASTREMQRAFERLSIQAQLMPTIGLQPKQLPFRAHPPSSGALKLLFVGNVITLKGIDLAIEALRASQTDATFTVVGTGNFLPAARDLAARLKLGERVRFIGRLPREEVLKIYPDYDVFVFPSLHDTGGYAVIEAMFNELPVICLDCGGPAVAVQEGCGVRVALRSRKQVIADLGAAIRLYSQQRTLVATHGRSARAVVLKNYDWDRKGEEMNLCYEAALERFGQRASSAPPVKYSGMRGFPNLLHRTLSVRGLITSVLTLLLIGLLGFASLSQLKRQARDIVVDTLPGLSFAGEANASLSQAFDRCLLSLLEQEPAERERLFKEVDEYSRQTTAALDAYRLQIYSADDQRLFEQLLRSREQYTQVREQVFSLLKNEQHREAVAVVHRELLPAYASYKASADRLFEYNMQQGETRGKGIMQLCTATQLTVALIGILVFAAGFLSGMFK